MIKVKKAFCFFSLKVGAYIVGLVFLLLGLVNVGIFLPAWTWALPLGILEVLTSFSLLVGAKRKKPIFILPILVWIPVDLVISVILLVWMTGWMSVILVIIFPVYGYIWVCQFSFWKQSKDSTTLNIQSGQKLYRLDYLWSIFTDLVLDFRLSLKDQCY